MGCGCKERKERIARHLEERKMHRTARMLRRVPTPSDVARVLRPSGNTDSANVRDG
jgi:hypothetical protein